MYAWCQLTQWDVPDCDGPGVLDCGFWLAYAALLRLTPQATIARRSAIVDCVPKTREERQRQLPILMLRSNNNNSSYYTIRLDSKQLLKSYRSLSNATFRFTSFLVYFLKFYFNRCCLFPFRAVFWHISVFWLSFRRPKALWLSRALYRHRVLNCAVFGRQMRPTRQL